MITLTSDLGTRDYFVAAVKAAILSQAPDATIVDITHDCRPFDIAEAAFQVRSVFQEFPMGAVHVLGINPELKMDQPHVVVHYMSHYFVGADNGIFSLLFDTVPEDIWEISLPHGDHWTFPMKGVFATVAAHLSKGGSPEMVGKRVKEIRQVLVSQPMIEGEIVKASVVHVDGYGNIYTNVSRDLFHRIRAGRTFAITFKRASFAIEKISEYYTEVIEGERLAMFASNGWLMIAINGGVTKHGGGAAELFGLKLNDIIRIEFHGDPNREDDFQAG